MARHGVAAVMVIAAGCGRYGFDASIDAAGHPDGDPISGDGGILPEPLPPSLPPLPPPAQVVHPKTASAASIKIPMSLTAGDLVILGVDWNDAASTITLSGTGIPAFTPLEQETIVSGCSTPAFGTVARLWFGIAAKTGTVTITATQSHGTAFLGAMAVAYAGVGPLLAHVGQIAVTPSNEISAGTLAGAGGLVVALFLDSLGDGSIVPSPGASVLATDEAAYALLEATVVPAGDTSITAQLPAGVSDACWVGVAAEFALP